MTDSPKTRLRSLGVRQPDRVLGWIANNDLYLPEKYWPYLERCADPDAAILALVRLFEAAPATAQKFAESAQVCLRFLVVAGLSDALADLIVAHPQLLDAFSSPLLDSSMSDNHICQIIHRTLKSVGKTTDTLRATYYRILLEIVCLDLLSVNSVAEFSTVSKALSDLADGTLQAALEIAKTEVNDAIEGVHLAIIALGKCGAQELNYISDVDVIFVAQWPENADEKTALRYATRLATTVSGIVSGPGQWRSLWPLDVGLRPEGNDGALVRGLESYRSYYQQWAQSWEFQALLKARPAAGDLALGKQFVDLVSPFVWRASARPEFVEQARTMRQRVESNIRHTQRKRHLKLGAGGLRDVEFTVQLLQLVHGRVDSKLRSLSTLDALAALTRGGYINRVQAAELEAAYRFLRTLEHHIQLQKLKRSHLVPTNESQLLRVARSLSIFKETEAGLIPLQTFSTAQELEQVWKAWQARVRHLHESLFYRPLLPVTAALNDADMELTPEAARDRLLAIGYLDPTSALRQIKQLTAGISRRAAIVRQILPAMLGWMANGADPDRGLLEFRIIAEEVGDSQWFGRTLRDSKQAAKRLCKILPTSLLLSEEIKVQPTIIRWLDGDSNLAARTVQDLLAEQDAVLSRQESSAQAAQRVRAIRGREMARAALADMIYGVDIQRTGMRLADSTQVAIEGALRIAKANVDGADDLSIAVIALGRLGGFECGYGSDADLVVIHNDEGKDSTEAAQIANSVAVELRQILTSSPHGIGVDYGLRPEGKQGALSRSLSALERYYASWSVAWERQALVRARPIAGDAAVAQKYLQIVDELRWESPLDAKQIKEIRLLKARMEKERLPRGHKPSRNVKLGPGGLSDVEWAVQFIQLQYASSFPGLRQQSTLGALKAAEESGLIPPKDAHILREAWIFASKIRVANGLVLGHTRGPKIDVLPTTDAQRVAVARVLGYKRGYERRLEDDYLRAARRARDIHRQIFQGHTTSGEEYM